MRMRAILALAAVLAALPFLSAPATPARAELRFCLGSVFLCGDTDPFDNNRSDTNFDLGIDVSNVPLTRAGVNQFMATLTPEGQRIMLTTCKNYLGYPGQVQSPRTLQFCAVLLGG